MIYMIGTSNTSVFYKDFSSTKYLYVYIFKLVLKGIKDTEN